MHKLFQDYWICPTVTGIFSYIFAPTPRGNAPQLNSLEDAPSHWHTAWQKGQRGTQRTWEEEVWSRAAELIVHHTSAVPLWVGVISTAWMWLLTNGGLAEAQTSEFINKYRGLLIHHAMDTWRARAEIVYSSDNEAQRLQRSSQYQEAIHFIQQHHLTATHTIHQIMQLNSTERVALATSSPQKRRTQTTLVDKGFAHTRTRVPPNHLHKSAISTSRNREPSRRIYEPHSHHRKPQLKLPPPLQLQPLHYFGGIQTRSASNGTPRKPAHRPTPSSSIGKRDNAQRPRPPG